MGNSDSEDEFEKKPSERKKAKKAKKEQKRLKKKLKEQQQQSVLFTTSTTSTTSKNNSNNNSKSSCSTPSSRSSNSTMNSSTDKTAQQKSPRSTSFPCVPKEIKSPRDLYWHKKQSEKETRYLPCYILHGEKKKIEIDSSDESDSDEEEELQVVYLSFHIKGRPHHFYPNEEIKTVGITQKRLIPFHGHRTNNYDHDDYGTLGWCEVSMQTYLQYCQGNSKIDLHLEREYLMHVLVESRKRAGYSAVDDDIIVVDGKRNRIKGLDSFIDVDEDDGIGNAIDSDDLEEPYTQALSNCGSDSDSDDMRGFRRFRRKRNTKCGEPIRPGDVIEYYNPIFVFGK